MERISVGDLQIDLNRHEVVLRGEPQHLKPKEFELLVFLARNRGIVLTRDLILERSGAGNSMAAAAPWTSTCAGCARKLERNPAHPQRIVTLRGVGYRFVG